MTEKRSVTANSDTRRLGDPLLRTSRDDQHIAEYTYGQDGERSGKYSMTADGGHRSETLYFNKMWAWHYDGLLNEVTGRNSKHVYLGENRIVTKINRANSSFMGEERIKQYYYHSDHLGSAQVISNADGEEYERIEYTPYGELWIEKASTASNIDIPYRFTGKERDDETGLYYYGARYLDSKASRWLSADPAFGEYIPGAPVDDEARKRNQNLPGQGGVFNLINLHLYHYAGNNPVRYTDPDGETGVAATLLWDAFLGNGEHQDYSQNLDFLHTFTLSPMMNKIINTHLQSFKESALLQKTFEGPVSFYDDPADFDLMLGVGTGKYSVTITAETKTRGLFKKTEVTVYHIMVTISDTYDFDDYRDDGSLGSKLNNWGYDKQQEGDIKPYTWSFTYGFDQE